MLDTMVHKYSHLLDVLWLKISWVRSWNHLPVRLRSFHLLGLCQASVAMISFTFKHFDHFPCQEFGFLPTKQLLSFFKWLFIGYQDKARYNIQTTSCHWAPVPSSKKLLQVVINAMTGNNDMLDISRHSERWHHSDNFLGLSTAL